MQADFQGVGFHTCADGGESRRTLLIKGACQVGYIFDSPFQADRGESRNVFAGIRDTPNGRRVDANS